jgi:hypothetical protein
MNDVATLTRLRIRRTELHIAVAKRRARNKVARRSRRINRVAR